MLCRGDSQNGHLPDVCSIRMAIILGMIDEHDFKVYSLVEGLLPFHGAKDSSVDHYGCMISVIVALVSQPKAKRELKI